MMYCYEIGTFLKPSNPQPYRKVIFIISVIAAFTAGNIVQSPAQVLFSDVTPPTQQSLMSDICQVYNRVSSIFANLLGGLTYIFNVKYIFYSMTKVNPFIRTIASFCLAFVTAYQYQVTFSDFIGDEIMHGHNANDASDEMKDRYQKGVLVDDVQYHEQRCSVIGMKWAMIVGNFLIASLLVHNEQIRLSSFVWSDRFWKGHL